MPKKIAYSDTEVSVSRSQERIRQLFSDYGVEAFQFSESLIDGRVQIQFRWQGLVIEIPFSIQALLQAMLRQAPYTSRKRVVQSEYEAKFWHKASKSIWRHVEYWLKAQFDAIETGIVSFPEAFMSGVLDPQGRRLGDVVVPQLRQYAAGNLALPEPTEERAQKLEIGELLSADMGRYPHRDKRTGKP